ncbi:MAG: DUF393 domain-containing protein [Flavobacteriales bacterium]|nr:DUF393 domain-containing protein [Flavobacteriales bacterium]MCB9448396.1 DUF393 domain-containing protein [Flavobacteriales bacterium]
MEHLPDHIIFFDGHCHLCSGAVQWILKRDKRRVFFFAPLQSGTAATLLPPEMSDLQNMGTFVYVRNGVLLIRSTAALAMLNQLGGIWSVLSWLKVVPRPIRDAAYNLVARNRYKWFGKREVCMMPQPGNAERFLD